MQIETLQPEDAFFNGLPVGTKLLLGQYRVEEELVRGGFGITYLARDSLDRQVVVKECFVDAICLRHANNIHANSSENQAQFARIRKHFLREARRMAKLSHPNIVGVHQVFEENNTAYMVLDHVKGMDLQTMIETCPERLTPPLVRSVLQRCLEAIDFVHSQGLLHGDISPDNIMLDFAGNVQLIDFGSAQERVSDQANAPSRILSVKDGYSPQEFYSTEEEHGPASDLYALGATMHHLIAGAAPALSLSRIKSVATEAQDCYRPLTERISGYDRPFLAAIDRALALYPEDRPQSAREWLEALGHAVAPQAAAAPAPSCAVPQPGEAATAPAPATGAPGDIRRVISQLVADVNGTIQPVQPGTREQEPAEQPASAAPAQLVDMFGTPIENVEAWLDAQSRKNRKATRLIVPAGSAKPEPRGLRQLMHRLLSRTHSTDPITHNA